MGNFYVNITLRGPIQQDVATRLKELQRTAFISPTVNGITTVYDSECDSQDKDIIGRLSKKLSGHFSCPAWAVLNHDDDILAYELYNDGDLVDEYDSSPGYFGSDDESDEFMDEDSEDEPVQPAGGNSKLLAGLVGALDAVAEVEDILSTPPFEEDGFLFAVERHQALADHLGLPSFTVGYGYNYIAAGELPDGYGEGDFLEL